MRKLCGIVGFAGVVFVFGCMVTYGQESMVREPRFQKPKMVLVHEGKVDEASASEANSAATSTSAPPFLLNQSCKFCQPLSTIELWYQALQAITDPVSVSVEEYYYGSASSPIWARPIGARGANESAPGYFPSIQLYSAKLFATDTFQGWQYGRYDFLVTFHDMTTREVIQNARLTAYILWTQPSGEVGPIVIDHVVTATTAQGYQFFTIYGTFPKNQPMDFYFGIMGFEGGFSVVPGLVSYDGQTIVTGGIAGPGVHTIRGDVTLETADGTFATILKGCFTF